MNEHEDFNKFYDLIREQFRKYNKPLRDPQSNPPHYVPLDAAVIDEMKHLVRLSLKMSIDESGDIVSARIFPSSGGNPDLTRHWKIKSLEMSSLPEKEAPDAPEKD